MASYVPEEFHRSCDITMYQTKITETSMASGVTQTKNSYILVS